MERQQSGQPPIHRTAFIHRALSTLVCLVTLNTVYPWSAKAQLVPQPVVQSETDWSIWHPNTDPELKSFTAGFSNMELGGFMDFRASCGQQLGLSTQSLDQIPYWFRLSKAFYQLGLGSVEYGCWVNGQMLNTFTITAVSLQTVACWEVIAAAGLPIWNQPPLFPGPRQMVRTLQPGTQFSAPDVAEVLVEANGQNWFGIMEPVSGYVTNGAPGSPERLQICRS